ncbi:MAG TPA: VOC family protein [Verrucomicrobiae bacterium]|nr:VOC family protein [Verrucomicrobiae bacterium]
MKIEHVAFNVADPVAMAQWYETHLAMRTVRSSGPPTHTRFLADTSGQMMVEIYRHPKASVPDYRNLDPLILHLAFAADDVRATRARLLEAGCVAEGDITTTDGGDELAMLRDPWGLPIQIARRRTPMRAG